MIFANGGILLVPFDMSYRDMQVGKWYDFDPIISERSIVQRISDPIFERPMMVTCLEVVDDVDTIMKATGRFQRTSPRFYSFPTQHVLKPLGQHWLQDWDQVISDNIAMLARNFRVSALHSMTYNDHGDLVSARERNKNRIAI